MQDQIKSMFKDMLDVDLEDDLDLSSPEALFAKIAKQMQQQQEQKFNQEKPPQPKKSAKALAKEAAQKQAEQEVSMSIKAVYRQLVTTLHPDKEQDPQERERKTSLMQRVNVAYNEKDLLSLLELQLEVEQINQATINSMPEERINHYNRVLTDQVFELKQEILGIKQAMCFQFSTLAKFNNFMDKLFTPNRIINELAHEILEIKEVVKQIDTDLILFSDIKNIKDFLKSHIIYN
jgi:archaellum component FlaC